jgi:hypothetical protein
MPFVWSVFQGDEFLNKYKEIYFMALSSVISPPMIAVSVNNAFDISNNPVITTKFYRHSLLLWTSVMDVPPTSDHHDYYPMLNSAPRHEDVSLT